MITDMTERDQIDALESIISDYRRERSRLDPANRERRDQLTRHIAALELVILDLCDLYGILHPTLSGHLR